MNTLRLHLASPAETARFGSVLARLLAPGDVVLLLGELGAGKTTLVRAVAAARGVDPRSVSSPTFTVVHEYTPAHGPPIVHVDAYRLTGDDEDELMQLGWDRSASPDAIVLIEWGSRIEHLLQDGVARLTLSHESLTERLATLEAPDSWADRPGWGEASRLARGATFGSDREQWADLYRWMSGQYRISRPANADDFEARGP